MAIEPAIDTIPPYEATFVTSLLFPLKALTRYGVWFAASIVPNTE